MLCKYLAHAALSEHRQNESNKSNYANIAKITATEYCSCVWERVWMCMVLSAYVCVRKCVCVCVSQLQLISISGCGIGPACFYMQFPHTHTHTQTLFVTHLHVLLCVCVCAFVCVCVLCAQLAPKSTKSTNQTKGRRRIRGKLKLNWGDFSRLCCCRRRRRWRQRRRRCLCPIFCLWHCPSLCLCLCWAASFAKYARNLFSSLDLF